MEERQETLLALDTATDDVVVGLATGPQLAFGASISHAPDERPRHVSALLAEVERAVDGAGGWERIERIGIGIGPGSYTGVRIGIATGRALAQARGLPVVPVGTLNALALGIAESSGEPERLCLAVADARRGELFAQLHDGRGAPLGEPAVLNPSRLTEWLAETGGRVFADAAGRPLAGGSGTVRFGRELEAAGVELLPGGDSAHRLSPRHLCRLAAAGEVSEPERVLPVYLREPDAKRWLERDRNKAAGL